MRFKNIRKKDSRKKKDLFPSNSRTIPASVKTSTVAKALADRSAGKAEHFKFSLPKINHALLLIVYRRVLKIFVAFLFVVAAIVVGMDLQKNLQIAQDIDFQRNILIRDLKFWEDFISKNQNYRDAYFQASILEYKLGDTSKAKMYVEKGLVLDPNSENGRKIEKFLVNK